MKKIAIIRLKDSPAANISDEYDVPPIRESITDWTEVDDETYDLLIQAQYSYVMGYGFKVITREENEPEFIKHTVENYVKKIKEDEKRKAEANKRYQEKYKEQTAKRKLKQYEKLKAEFEGKNKNEA